MRKWFPAARRMRDSYITSQALPTGSARGGGYIRCMKEQRMFADVSLPFHVWVREGRRWVLRDAASRLDGAASSPRETPISPGPSKESFPRSRR